MIKLYKFANIYEIEHFLNGGILGGLTPNRVFDGQPGIPGLVGLTLTFSAPSGAVTFAAGTNGPFLRFSDLKSQIEAALGADKIEVVSVNDKLGFIHPTGASAIKLASDDEVAKSILGFSQNKVVEGKVYGAVASSPPAIIEAYAANDGSHTVFCVE